MSFGTNINLTIAESIVYSVSKTLINHLWSDMNFNEIKHYIHDLRLLEKINVVRLANVHEL